MSLKIEILQGIPSSGKTTYARKKANEDTSYVIISRDSIRESLGKYWVPKREKLITDIEYKCIKLAIERNYNVLLDSTNLNPYTIRTLISYIQDLKDELNKEITYEFKKFEVPLYKAIIRDWWRGFKGDKKVGKKVIKDFYERYN